MENDSRTLRNQHGIANIRTMNRLRQTLIGVCWFVAANIATGQTPSLDIAPGSGARRLDLRGQAGVEHTLQVSDALGAPTNWADLLTVTITNASNPWFDNLSGGARARFYRLMRPSAPLPPVFAPEIRLLDHQDRMQELFYHTHRRAVVLVLTGNNCTNSTASIPVIQALRNQFGPLGVLFQLLNADNFPNRTNLAAWATAHSVDLPVLHDPGLLLTRELGARSTTEAFCFNTTNGKLFYRGALDDRPVFNQAPTAFTQNYVSNALASFLAGRVVTPSRTPAQGCSIPVPTVTNISYATQVAPLLQARCVHCHSPGNIGNWAMASHQVVSNFAGAIRHEVLARRMPPWHADPQHGRFTNDVSLTPDEIATLVQWANAGAPRGAGPDPLAANPPPPAVDWPLGPPDAIISIPRQSLPANGEVAYRYVDLPSPFTSNVWLRAAVVKPGNRRVVHHVLVYFGSNSAFMGLDGYFAGYVPGTDQGPYPAGTGKLLTAGTQLRFQVHYTTTGQVESDQTQLGFYLAPAPPAAELQTKSAYDFFSFFPFFGAYSIPAGEADYPAVTASFTPSTTKDVMLYEMSPHMHYRGSRFKYEAVYTNNSREVLLSVPKYDFHWQTLYRLATPKRLPAGTRIVCSGAFDNSPQNRHNPNSAISVLFGEQTDDEMFIGYLNFAVIP